MIKLFASDMDGTLLTNHVEVHKNNIQAIRKSPKTGETLYRLYWTRLSSSQFCARTSRTTSPCHCDEWRSDF